MAVERDVKPRNVNFSKIEKGGGGGGGGGGEGGGKREGAFIRINTVVFIHILILYEEASYFKRS